MHYCDALICNMPVEYLANKQIIVFKHKYSQKLNVSFDIFLVSTGKVLVKTYSLKKLKMDLAIGEKRLVSTTFLINISSGVLILMLS